MKAFLLGMVCGAFLFYCYDWLRIYRRVRIHGKCAVFIEDFSFFTFTFVLIFQILQKEYQGMLRYHFVLAAFLGMISYQQLAEKWLFPSVVLVCKKWKQKKEQWKEKWKRRLTRRICRVKIFLCKQITVAKEKKKAKEV